jgi:hypothetical protein
LGLVGNNRRWLYSEGIGESSLTEKEEDGCDQAGQRSED